MLSESLSAAEPATTFELPRGDAVLFGDAVGTGAPVIFLHAGLERRQVWTPVIDELRRALEVKCVAIDQRGHGESTGSVDGLTPVAEDAAALIEWVEQPTVVVGSSLGGMASIAAIAEASIRARVLGLVLVDILADPEPTAVRRFLHDSGLMPRAARLADDILSRGPELRNALAHFAGGVLLIRGGHSAITDDDVARLQSYCPQVQVATVPKAGHLIARDAPIELARLIAGTLPRWLGPRAPMP